MNANTLFHLMEEFLFLVIVVTMPELHPHHRKKGLFPDHLMGNTRSKSLLLMERAV
jgi:hypothetical protein